MVAAKTFVRKVFLEVLNVDAMQTEPYFPAERDVPPLSQAVRATMTSNAPPHFLSASSRIILNIYNTYSK